MPLIQKIASRLYDFSEKVYVTGVLNVTPDSFSDGGLFSDPEKAVEQALRMEEEGADFLDIGAESTRPGAKPVPEEEEVSRLLPILQRLIPRLKIPVSVDTRKATVARRAVGEGAAIVNDVSGFQFDPRMIPFLRDSETPAVLMHCRGTPEMVMELDRRLEELERAGISRERLWLDPGIGFGKTGNQNVEILSHLSEFKKWGRPLMVGLSRKSFLEPYFGPTEQPRDRAMGTEIAHTLAILNGANILRVHDVKAAKKTIQFLETYQHARESEKGVPVTAS
jgi:dihydropteroate synthase